MSERVPAIRMVQIVDGLSRSTRIAAGEGVWVRTADSGGKYEQAVVLGFEIPHDKYGKVFARVLWLWTAQDVEQELVPVLEENGVKVDSDCLIRTVGKGQQDLIPLESFAYDRFVPYFKHEEPHLELFSMGARTQRIVGFLHVTEAAGVLLQQFLPDVRGGPRRDAKTVLEFCRQRVAGGVPVLDASAAQRLQRAGHVFIGDDIVVDVRSIPAAPLPGAAEAVVRAPGLMENGMSPPPSPPRAPAAAQGPRGTVHPTEEGNSALEEGDDLLVAAVLLPSAEDVDAHPVDRRRTRSGDDSFVPVPKRLRRPVDLWDESLGVVEALAPRHFHWEVAKVAGKQQFEAKGFGTNTWKMKDDTACIEVSASHYYDILTREIATQLARNYNKLWVTTCATLHCPPGAAGLLVKDLGVLHSSKEKINPVYRAGVAKAPRKAQEVEVRLTMEEFIYFLGYPGTDAPLDNRITFKRIVGAEARRVTLQLRGLTPRQRNEKDPQVVSVTYNTYTQKLAVKMKTAPALHRRKSPEGNYPFDLQTSVAL